MRNEISRVFKDSTVYGLGSLLPRAAAIILTPIYTAYLTRADYGVMSFAMMVSSMLGTVMVLGQNGAVTLFYRRTAAFAEERREMLFTVFCLVMVFGGAIILVGFLVGPALAGSLSGTKDVPFYPYLALALLIAYIGVPQSLQQAVNRALGQAKLFTAFQLSAYFINTGFTLYFLVALHQGAYGSMKGTLVAAIIILPPCLVVLIRRWRMRFSTPALRRTLRFGLPLVPHYFAGWALTFIDRFLLMALGSAAQVGLYSLAYNFSMILNLFCTSINTAWAPIFYDLAESQDGLKKLPRLTTVYAASVTALAIGFTMFAPDALVILANQRFHAAAPVVPVVAGGYFFFAMYMLVSTPIFHARKTGWAPAISVGAAVVNVLLNLYLIPRYGMLGAAWATFVSYACMALTAHAISVRVKPGVYQDRMLVALVGIYLLALAATIALMNVSLNVWLDIAVKMAVVPLFFGLLLLFRFMTIAEVRAFLRRKPARVTRTMEEEEVAAELNAEQVGSSPDATGAFPDNQRET